MKRMYVSKSTHKTNNSDGDETMRKTTKKLVAVLMLVAVMVSALSVSAPVTVRTFV